MRKWIAFLDICPGHWKRQGKKWMKTCLDIFKNEFNKYYPFLPRRDTTNFHNKGINLSYVYYIILQS